MHNDLNTWLNFVENPGTTEVWADDFCMASDRLIQCGAMKQWYIDLSDKEDKGFHRVVSQVVQFVGKALDRKEDEEK
jgi:hypothetical protein